MTGRERILAFAKRLRDRGTQCLDMAEDLINTGTRSFECAEALEAIIPLLSDDLCESLAKSTPLPDHATEN